MSEQDIVRICDVYDIRNYVIREDGLVDILGNVFLGGFSLRRIPLHFGKVSGGFYCGNNKLTSLKGCPISVGDHFSCVNNRLIAVSYHHLFELGYDIEKIVASEDLVGLYRQWVLNDIFND
jgi:hypothetical protein